MNNIKNKKLKVIYRYKYQEIYKKILRHWQLYILIALPLIYLFVFRYIPMWGSRIAFKDYNFSNGIAGSPWTTQYGLKHFITFFNSPKFSELMKNTIILSVYNIFIGMFPPIILAISLNCCRKKKFGKVVQMITYMPYFISTVLVVGIMTQLLSLQGPINNIINFFGFAPIQFMGEPKWFRTLYVFSGVWQGAGYSAVIYIAALASIPQELYEAAIVDGASTWKRVLHIDVPSITPTIVILLIMACGRVLTLGYEKALLMQNPLNMQTADIISTYVYRIGLESMQYSYSTAIGLFQSVVSLVMLIMVNQISKKVNETSLW
ncbi:MAG: ABC transporter permease [Lachnospirales bacterium]